MQTFVCKSFFLIRLLTENVNQTKTKTQRLGSYLSISSWLLIHADYFLQFLCELKTESHSNVQLPIYGLFLQHKIQAIDFDYRPTGWFLHDEKIDPAELSEIRNSSRSSPIARQRKHFCQTIFH